MTTKTNKPTPKCTCGHARSTHHDWWKRHKSACYAFHNGKFFCPCLTFKAKR